MGYSESTSSSLFLFTHLPAKPCEWLKTSAMVDQA